MYKEIILNILTTILTIILIFTPMLKYFVQKYIDKLMMEKVEKLKKELELYNILQSTLYQRRIEVLENFYNLLVEYLLAYGNYILSIRDITGLTDEEVQNQENERTIKVVSAYRAAYEFYLKYKIYFSPSLKELLDKLFKISHSDFNSIFFAKERLKSAKLTMEETIKANENFENEILKIMEQIEREFQRLLGIIDENIH